MPVSTFDTLPLELQERSKAAERQRVKCELLRRERDARAATERGALNNDWVGISGQRLGDVAEQARRFVLEQAPPRDEPPSSPDPAAVRGEVSVQHEQTRKVFALRQAKGLKYLDEKEPHCRVITRAVVARASAEELAEMVRKRLERLGVQVPKHLRPSTLQVRKYL
ncbi:hypothetical protein T492DRAFT_273329 [Pavlovales sp. CCMP2436]|nr:hypothetical protein T492DRAFT_273329 [Pavlovales sp. CCMP2436]